MLRTTRLAIRRKWLIVSLVIAIAVLIPATPQVNASQPPSKTEIPASAVLAFAAHPCTGDPFTDVSGSFVLLNKITEDGNGGLHVVTRWNWDAVAITGESGNTYSFHGAGGSGSGFVPAEALEGSGTGGETGLIIGPGANWLGHVNVALTLDGRGSVIGVEVTNARFDCVG